MINLGIIKTNLSRVVAENLLSENKDINKVNLYKNFLNILKESDILMLQYNICKNFEQNNHSIESAYNIISENLRPIKYFTKKEIINENKKIKDFNIKNNLSQKENTFYNAIHNLIMESTAKYPDINLLHESHEIILNSLIEKKSLIKEERQINKVNNAVINLATKKINEEIGKFSSKEKDILQTLSKGTFNDKVMLLENIKSECKILIEDSKSLIEDYVYENTINKINNIDATPETINESILDLYSLLSDE
jgi:hypothetical protein